MASIVERNNSVSVVYYYQDEDGNKKQKWETVKKDQLDRSEIEAATGKRVKEMVANRMRKDSMLKRTLFNLYPISALLFLASSTIKQETFNKVKLLSECDDSILKVAFKSVPKFLDSSVNIPLNDVERINLINQLGLYGVFIVTNLLKNSPNLSFEETKAILHKESGADSFMKVLHNHFGSRARLIKLESIYQCLSQEMDSAQRNIKDATFSRVLVTVKAKLRNLFSSLMHEHLEYETLNKIYNGELFLDDRQKALYRGLG